jgi:uncharacterized protein YuzE
MEIGYDPDARASYIAFQSRARSWRTVEAGPATQLDYDLFGNLVGIELLNVYAVELPPCDPEYPATERDRWVKNQLDVLGIHEIERYLAQRPRF